MLSGLFILGSGHGATLVPKARQTAVPDQAKGKAPLRKGERGRTSRRAFWCACVCDVDVDVVPKASCRRSLCTVTSKILPYWLVNEA